MRNAQAGRLIKNWQMNLQLQLPTTSAPDDVCAYFEANGVRVDKQSAPEITRIVNDLLALYHTSLVRDMLRVMSHDPTRASATEIDDADILKVIPGNDGLKDLVAERVAHCKVIEHLRFRMQSCVYNIEEFDKFMDNRAPFSAALDAYESLAEQKYE